MNQSSIPNAQVKCAVGEEGRLSFRNAVAVLALVFCLQSSNSFAVTDDNIPFKIPQQRADTALILFAEHANLTLVVPFDQVKEFTANRLVGNYPIDTAINILLQDTGLMPTFSNQLVLNIAIDDKGKSMNTNTRKTLLASMVGLFAAGGMATATAQDSVADTNKSSSLVLDEIVITATKRQSSVQDSALSVAVMGDEDISRRGLSSMDDYLKVTPGANYIERGVGTNAVIIRGISSDPQRGSSLGGPAVGVYFGEAPIAGLSILGGSADIQLVDMARVEVLRGPQGTLFGAGSLSGTVRNVPEAPVMNEFEGKLKAELSGTGENGGDNYKLSGTFNIPIVEDVLSLRGSIYDNQYSGYVKNIADSFTGYADVAASVGAGNLAVDQNEVGETSYTGGRLTALWTPTEELDVTLMYVTQEIDQDGTPDVQINTGGYTQTRLQFKDFPESTVPGFGGVPGNKHSGEGRTNDLEFVNLIIDYDFGWANLISSTLSYEEENLQELGLAPFFGGLPAPLLFDFESEAIVEELRLVSQLDGPFQYIVGLYYEDISIDRRNVIHWGADISENPFGTPFGPDNTLLDLNYVFRDVEQKALFSEVSYDLSQTLEVTLGARFYRYDRVANSMSGGVLSGDDTKRAEFDESGSNFKANVSYRPDDDSLYYLQWSEGFRLGSTQNPIPKNLCDIDNDNILDGTTLEIQDGIESDTLENFEAGAKISVLDDRMNINVAVYRINWDGIPVSAISPTCLFTAVANAGKARSQGLEIETEYYVKPGLLLSVGGALNDAELTEDAVGLGDRGDRLPGTPEYSANLGLQYEFELSGRPSYVRGDYAYVGSYFNNLQELGQEAGDYSQLNISAGIDFDKFSIGLFAKNLTNADDFTWVDTSVPDTRAYRLRPRTIGINAEITF